MSAEDNNCSIELRVPLDTVLKFGHDGCVHFTLSGVGEVKLFDRDCPSHGFEPIHVRGLLLDHTKKWWAHTFDLKLGATWPMIVKKAQALRDLNLIQSDHLAHVRAAAQEHQRLH